MDAEESLDLLRCFAFGFRKQEKGEENTEDAKAAKHPKGSGTSDGFLNIDERERDDEGQKPVGERGDRAARSFDSGRQNLAEHEPRHGAGTHGKSGNKKDKRRQR